MGFQAAGGSRYSLGTLRRGTGMVAATAADEGASVSVMAWARSGSPREDPDYGKRPFGATEAGKEPSRLVGADGQGGEVGTLKFN